MVVFVLNESLKGNMLQCQLFFLIMMNDLPPRGSQKMTKGQGISLPLEKGREYHGNLKHLQNVFSVEVGEHSPLFEVGECQKNRHL